MDVVKIVLIANACYAILLMMLIVFHYKTFSKEIHSDDPSVANLYFHYSPFGAIMILSMIMFTLIRNGHIFNDYWPVSFLIQFGFQIVYLACVFISTTNRIVMRFGFLMMMGVFGATGYNGLFVMARKFTPMEITIHDLNKLSKDVDDFNAELNNRLAAINKNMNAIIGEISSRGSELKRVNKLIDERKEEADELTSVVQIDQKRADEILRALNYHPPTLMDKIIDATIAFIVGVITTLFYEKFISRILKRKTP